AETVGPTVVRSGPGADAPGVSRLRAGILLPVTGRSGDFLAVRTPCLEGVWVSASDVRLHPPAPTPGLTGLGSATFVLDPGHGGIDAGAVGPGGLREKEVNLAIAAHLADLLREAPALEGMPERGHGAPRVFLTRDSDHFATLGYRTALANALNAHALVSIHNNAEPDGPSAQPGTETYYQVATPGSQGSKRIAGLALEEIRGALTPLGGPWMSDTDAGAKYRRNSRGGDYYGILRGAQVPSALLEIMFISHAREEALLRRADVQRLTANAIYRALVRYATTDDPGSGFVEPYPRGTPAGGGRVQCVDPA
ncbi:MAG TPA: N-acetylmuramoyl-L-alanine amidase, partial [Actinomycetota bacterium]|nr:N-acetylmuramoyl-L-alanine amidase [Actinomycetota bacterium]